MLLLFRHFSLSFARFLCYSSSISLFSIHLQTQLPIIIWVITRLYIYISVFFFLSFIVNYQFSLIPFLFMNEWNHLNEFTEYVNHNNMCIHNAVRRVSWFACIHSFIHPCIYSSMSLYIYLTTHLYFVYYNTKIRA